MPFIVDRRENKVQVKVGSVCLAKGCRKKDPNAGWPNVGKIPGQSDDAMSPLQIPLHGAALQIVSK